MLLVAVGIHSFLKNNIYLITTLLMTILTFTWREKYDVTAFTTNCKIAK